MPEVVSHPVPRNQCATRRRTWICGLCL